MALRFTPKTIALLLVGSFVAGGGFAVLTRPLRNAARQPQHVSAKTQPRTRVPFTVAETILDGKLEPGWEDWGWGRHELADKEALRVDFGSYGGILLRHAVINEYFGALVFRFKAPESFGEFLDASLRFEQVGEDVLPRVPIERGMLADLPGGWTEALVPWARLNPTNSPIDRVVIRARKPVGSDWILLDKIVLTKPDASGIAVPPRRVKKVAVDCTKPPIRINPLIYGVAQGAADAGETGHRIGGNTMSRLNWELGAWNTGNDWYFENQPGGGPEGLWTWLDDNVRAGRKMALTVPTLGWVAKDGTSVGFPFSKFGKQRAHDPHRPEAGDGFDAQGKPLRPGPPTQTSMAAPPEVIRRWMQTLRERDKARGARGADIYILDNEPGLWHTTHRDVHPDPLTYDELLDRTLRYASVVREVDPEATIAGPAAWGWPEYFMSAKDLEIGWAVRPDRRMHGDTPLLAWYLEKLAEHEKKTGVRLLDLVDVHYYPQAQGLYGGAAKTDAASSELRLRSTRSLWDPTYRDESWINENIHLIPRLKEWIAQRYPGRGLMLGEWSFGADHHISGGLAIAEALGRFGQQGLTAAFYWDNLQERSPGYWAFRAFRNFDAKGATFLDWSVSTREADDLSLFASQNETRNKLVLVFVNRNATFAAEADIDVTSCGTVTGRRVFVYSEGSPALAEQYSEDSGAAGPYVPPYSIAVVEITLGGERKPAN